MKNYRLLGLQGYYRVDFHNKKNNEKAEKANKLVDEYNSKINTFETAKENNNFAKKINKKIERIFRARSY